MKKNAERKSLNSLKEKKSKRLGHASIQMTLDTYSHVAPGIQEAAAQSFDKLLHKSISSNLVANQ